MWPFEISLSYYDKSKRLPGDAIRHQEHHSKDNFGNPAMLGATQTAPI